MKQIAIEGLCSAYWNTRQAYRVERSVIVVKGKFNLCFTRIISSKYGNKVFKNGLIDIQPCMNICILGHSQID